MGEISDLESLEARELGALAQKIIASHAERDRLIDVATELFDRKWQVPLPPKIKRTLKPQHCSKPVDVTQRVVGQVLRNEAQFSRPPQDNDEAESLKADRVERYLQARHHRDRREGLPKEDAWKFTIEQFVKAGGATIGVVFAPQAWAASPPLRGADGQYRRDLWRDGDGKPTDDEGRVEPAAVSRAYMKEVERFRLTARPPIVRRFLPLRDCSPFHSGDQMLSYVVQRQVSPVELAVSGFKLDALGADNQSLDTNLVLTEVWTPNRCTYFLGQGIDQVLEHRVYGKACETNYGFVPFAYQEHGMPVLCWVENNIRMIDTYQTYLHNGISLDAFPTFYRKRDRETAMMPESQTRSIEIEPMSVMDFGGDEVLPFKHAGFSGDFYRFLEYQYAEIDRVIPRVLQGVGEGSGYESALMTMQAVSPLLPIPQGAAFLLEKAAVLEMRHIYQRVPAPFYLDYLQTSEGSSPRARRVRISKEDIGGYYGIYVSLERPIDHVTEGNWRAQMFAAGHGDPEWVAEGMGITDVAESEMRRMKWKVKNSPEWQQLMMQAAIQEFGLQRQARKAALLARIQTAPDGTPMVAMPDGNMAGPGMMPPQTPQMQGPVGAAMGGWNQASAGPNMASAQNPSIGLPTAQQPNRFARRGGNPGAPQMQGLTKPGLVK